MTYSDFEESTLTDRYQTTIPNRVRKTLGLSKRDKLCYLIQDDGNVTLTRAETEDPAIKEFLDFLSVDLEKNPQRISTISEELFNQISELTQDIVIDLNSPLPEENDALDN